MYSPHHIALSVSDLTRSIDFYQALGFKKVGGWEPEDGSFVIANLRNHSIILELFCYVNHHAMPEHAKDLSKDLPVFGIKHFGVQVDSIDEAKQEIQARGLEIMNEDINPDRSGANYFFVKDPDGLLVEIIEDNRGY